jgi:hypothetical protein
LTRYTRSLARRFVPLAVEESLADAGKLTKAWHTPTRDLGKTQQWAYNQQHERDVNTRRREQGYAVVGFG